MMMGPTVCEYLLAFIGPVALTAARAYEWEYNNIIEQGRQTSSFVQIDQLLWIGGTTIS